MQKIAAILKIFLKEYAIEWINKSPRLMPPKLALLVA
jgi:hypothetical protein